MSSLLQSGHSLGQVELLGQKLKQAVQKHGLLLEVEEHGLVKKVMVGHIDDALAELIVLPC